MSTGDYGWLLVGACGGAFAGYWVALIRVHLGAGWRAMRRRR